MSEHIINLMENIDDNKEDMKMSEHIMNLMEIIDDNKEDMKTNVYLQLCNSIKTLSDNIPSA